MAQPKTLKGSKVSIMLENTTPGTFVTPCALTTKGITFSAETNDFNVPDCDTPDAPTFTQRVVATLSAAINGAGTLAMEAFVQWREWSESGVAKKIRFKLDAPAADNGGYWEMMAILNTFTVTGNIGELAQIDVAIQSDGAYTWTDTTP